MSICEGHSEIDEKVKLSRHSSDDTRTTIEDCTPKSSEVIEISAPICFPEGYLADIQKILLTDTFSSINLRINSPNNDTKHHMIYADICSTNKILLDVCISKLKSYFYSSKIPYSYRLNIPLSQGSSYVQTINKYIDNTLMLKNCHKAFKEVCYNILSSILEVLNYFIFTFRKYSHIIFPTLKMKIKCQMGSIWFCWVGFLKSFY